MSVVSWLIGSKVGRLVGLVVAGVFVALLAFRTVLRMGEKQALVNSMEETEKRTKEARREADKIRKDLSGATDDELDQRLRDAGL